MTIANAALTATTANTIQGKKPSLSSTHITAISNEDDFKLFGLDVDGNKYFTDADISTKLNTVLNSASLSLCSLTPTTLMQKLGTGTGTLTVAYKTPVLTTDAIDNDGDGFIAGSLTGGATIDWYYKDALGAETKLTNVTSTFCDLASTNIVPYLKISGPVTLSTEYGDPRAEIYDINNAVTGNKTPLRQFYPVGVIMASYALLNPINDNVSTLHREWVSGKGFLPQSAPVPPSITATPNPSKNFPRTGFDGAFFDLTIAGATAADVISASGSTVSSTSGSGVTLALTANQGGVGTNVLRVTLAGPSFSSPPTAAFTPSTFKLYAGVGQTNEIYSFELSKWFIAHSSLITQTAAKNYCNSLALLGNYRLPSLGDYTNSKRVDDLMSWSGTLSG